MSTIRALSILTALVAATACTSSAENSGAGTSKGKVIATPELLAEAMQVAFASGDLATAEALADLSQAPALARFMYLSTAVDCATTDECTTAVGPLTDEHRESLAQQAAAQGIELAAPPEGMIKISSTSRDGTGTGTLEMPYAKIDGSYRIVTARYTKAELAKLRAKTNEQLAEELFAQGLYDPELGDHRTDWASVATSLPADGGEPGAALVQRATAMAAAVDAGDPDAAKRSGGRVAEVIFRDKDWDETPIPLATRKLRLAVQGIKQLRDVDITGGWVLGGTAVLLVNAHNGAGWIERGAVVMVNHGDGWEHGGGLTVSYPKE